MSGQQTTQTATVTWAEDRVPVSTRFDDPYFSLHDGLAETRHVFLDGNDLPRRFRDGFHVAELGFGTGLNLIATALAWKNACVEGGLAFTSFEAFPMTARDMELALARATSEHALSSAIVDFWAAGKRVGEVFPGIHLTVIEGDARQTLPAWDQKADAWYLDGFSPAKNPQMWEDTLLLEVGRKTAKSGTAATYTAAGHVRRGLAAAGFEVARVPGYGRKRHMTTARLSP